MSEVVGKWIIAVQDEMPAEIRNSAEWRELLPLAAGTGREHEKERLEIILAWMWELLKGLQDHADKNGYGAEWRQMCVWQTVEASYRVYANDKIRHLVDIIHTTTNAIESQYNNYSVASISRCTALAMSHTDILKLNTISILRKLCAVS